MILFATLKRQLVLCVLSILALGTFQTEAFASMSLEESQFIAAVVRSDETSLEVWINPRKEWQNEGKLVSRYTADEAKLVADIVYRTGLCAVSGVRFKLCKPGKSIEDLKRDLEDAGVEVEAEFQNWADESRTQ